MDGLQRLARLNRHRALHIGLRGSELAAQTVDHEMLFRVIDDGEGLSPRADSPGMGVGLPLIARLAGRFEVRPGPSGRGTELLMSFPLV